MGTHLVLAVGVLILGADGGHGRSHNNRLRIRPAVGRTLNYRMPGSPLVTFSDTLGQDLEIGDFGTASMGQGLLVGDGPGEGSLLLMNFSSIVDFLSVDFGNDQPDVVKQGNEVILTAYLDGVYVGETNVIMNGDGVMNQSIAFSGAMFNSATIDFYLGLFGAEEVVDNIAFNPIPGPGTGLMALLGVGALHVRGSAGDDYPRAPATPAAWATPSAHP